MTFSVQKYSEEKLNLRKGEREREGEREGERERNNYILLQYAVLELPIDNEFEWTVYAVPACTAWLENITVKVSAKDGKQIKFAALWKWPANE